MSVEKINSKNLSIHVLRGISALLVLLHHEFSRFTVYWDFSRNYIDFGRVGVVSFFLISGFVIYGSASNRSLPSFIYLRFFRLYPVYWISLVLYLLVCQIASEKAIDNASITSNSAFNINARDLILNLTMFQELLGLHSMLPPAWTLSIELLFYISVCVSIRLKLPRWEDSLLFSSLALFGVMNVIEHNTGKQLPTSLPLLLSLAFLGCGYHARYKMKESIASLNLKAILVLLLIILFYSFGASDVLWNPQNRILSTALGTGMFLLFLSSRQIEASRIMLWLGDISYSLYILSPFVVMLCDTYITNELGQILGSIIFTLILSTLSFNYFEKPIIKWSKQKLYNL